MVAPTSEALYWGLYQISFITFFIWGTEAPGPALQGYNNIRHINPDLAGINVKKKRAHLRWDRRGLGGA